MDPREALLEVVGDVEEAKVRLRWAEAKMIESGLSEKPAYREVAAFIDSAMRNVQVASEAALRRRSEEL